MMAVLLLEDDVIKKREICALFSNAGYQITWADALGTLGVGGDQKSVTILQVAAGKLAPCYLASLTSSKLSPWRLSLQQHWLIAPNNKKTKLTSLEFTLIKLFALVEKGDVISRRRIIDAFGEHYLSYDQNRLDALVMRLRRKAMQKLDTALPLNTVRVRGFSFDDCMMLDY